MANSPPAMVGEGIGAVCVANPERVGTDFHLNVRPQSKPPRTSGEAEYCVVIAGFGSEQEELPVRFSDTSPA